MKLVHKETGKEVAVGDKVTSFRGEEETVTGIEKPRHGGSTGRIYTDSGGFYPSVFNLEWIEREDQG